MAQKKKKDSKLLKKCCCLTLKVGAFIVAVCFLVGIVLSFAYSLYHILLHGRGNAERRMAWVLEGELYKEIYRAAVRAQQSYERICTEGKQNFSDASIKDAWKKKGRTKDILRFLKMFKPKFIRRQKRSGSFISGYEDNFPEEKNTENEEPPLPDKAALSQFLEVETETHASQVTNEAAQEEWKMKYSVAANEKLSERSPLVVGELEAHKKQDAAWGSEIAVVRHLRAYNHNTMDLNCVQNAERAKRIAAQFYYALLGSVKSDFPRGAKKFYRRLDLFNVAFCVIFYILLMVLVCGIIIFVLRVLFTYCLVISLSIRRDLTEFTPVKPMKEIDVKDCGLNFNDNRVMVLLWLATIPFYFIFSMIYMYLRFAMMINIVGSEIGTAVFVIIIIILIPLVIFKYFVIFSYYSFMFSPIFWTMYSHNNMQMIVSRRGVDPNQQLK